MRVKIRKEQRRLNGVGERKVRKGKKIIRCAQIEKNIKCVGRTTEYKLFLIC